MSKVKYISSGNSNQLGNAGSLSCVFPNNTGHSYKLKVRLTGGPDDPVKTFLTMIVIPGSDILPFQIIETTSIPSDLYLASGEPFVGTKEFEIYVPENWTFALGASNVAPYVITWQIFGEELD